MTAASGVPLHRHQIAWLSEAGWRHVLDCAWDATARDCLAHWAARGLPLVVTRQLHLASEDSIALGLSAPSQWGRRRLALAVARSEVLYFDEFPPADRLLGALPVPARPAWRSLCADLRQIHAHARVYGSHGWQLLSGLDHVREGSDIDLWISVGTPEQADAVAARLQSAGSKLPRLDGELMFDDGSAVAWREWLAWRAGSNRLLLVKTVAGSTLVASPGWQDASLLAEAA